MSEWELQQKLTSKWASDGIDLAGERIFLLGWEVMVPSWDINDASVRWNEPSIDFLGIDRRGRLVATELKLRVPGRLPAWRVLCQVTHRAVCLRDTYTPERAEAVFRACRSGDHGRVSSGRPPGVSLAEELAGFYGEPVALDATHVRRVVAAKSFGPQWERVLSEFANTDDLAGRIVEMGLDARGDTREPRRILSLGELPELTSVETLRVEACREGLTGRVRSG